MLFTSLNYAIFLASVCTVYWLTPIVRVRTILLLVASLFFYATWNYQLAGLIALSTFVDYWLARGIDDSHSTRVRKILLTINIVANLGLLAYFKYANFFLDSLQSVLTKCGWQGSLPTLQVILPVGISFYTFEAINYMVDVYRRKVRAERDLSHFMLFITFFPHLVAGPIVRARDFLPQIGRPKRWDWLRAQLGVQLLLLGLFKKLVIADRLAVFADPIFSDPAAYRTSALWLGLLAYSLQIYCDFSGYTDMALGSAHLLGFKLAQNFNMPYLAQSVSEFWRRWHISLSTWLRDYLFIPLGGSRGGAWRTCRNLLITMTLGGLWHGASWNFVIWGIVHGLLLIGHRLWQDVAAAWPGLRKALDSAPGAMGCWLLTFVAVSLTWVLFRAATFEAAGAYYAGLFRGMAGKSFSVAPAALFLLVGFVVIGHLAGAGVRLGSVLRRMPGPALGLSYSLMFLATLALAPESGKAFIYFQF